MPVSLESLPHLAFWSVMLLLYGRVFWKAVKSRLAPEKTVRAVVVDKHTLEFFSKHSGNGKNTRYVVAFHAGGQTLSYYVSSISYHSYRKGKRGTLTYKGERLLSFK